MGQTTKKIRTVIGTQAEYDAAKSSYAQDIFYATDSHRIYARGNTFGMVDEGPWYTLTPYLYANSTTSYYYIKIAQINTGYSTHFRTLEFEVHDDANYATSCRYWLTMNVYSSTIKNLSLICTTTVESGSAQSARMEASMDTSGAVWVRFPSVDWGQRVRVRSVMEYASDGTAVSASIPFHTSPSKQTAKPANLSDPVSYSGGIRYSSGAFSYQKAYIHAKADSAEECTYANRLAAARTLWGQSFNGTANVSGDMTGVGKLSASGEILSSGSNAMRMTYGSKSVILRKDDDNFYILLSDSDTAGNNWNNLRPFFINLQTGLVTMQNGLTVNGGLSANTASVSGDLTVGGEAAIDGDLHVGGNIDAPQVAYARLLIPYELYSLDTGTQLADSHFAATEWKTLAVFKTALDQFAQYGTAAYVELSNNSITTRRTQAVFQYRESTAGQYYVFSFSTSASNVGDFSARIQFNLTKSTGVLQFGKAGV